jgi:peptidoglycan hydrolase CwlO-like protein
MLGRFRRLRTRVEYLEGLLEETNEQLNRLSTNYGRQLDILRINQKRLSEAVSGLQGELQNVRGDVKKLQAGEEPEKSRSEQLREYLHAVEVVKYQLPGTHPLKPILHDLAQELAEQVKDAKRKEWTSQ